jgi:hypothetical protein
MLPLSIYAMREATLREGKTDRRRWIVELREVERVWTELRRPPDGGLSAFEFMARPERFELPTY